MLVLLVEDSHHADSQLSSIFRVLITKSSCYSAITHHHWRVCCPRVRNTYDRKTPAASLPEQDISFLLLDHQCLARLIPICSSSLDGIFLGIGLGTNYFFPSAQTKWTRLFLQPDSLQDFTANRSAVFVTGQLQVNTLYTYCIQSLLPQYK